MGIKANFSKGDFQNELQRRVKLIEAQIIRYLQRLGELCLIECRTNKTYTDRSGNLTASMGYIIVAQGKVIENGGFGTLYGGSVGLALAEQKAASHKIGYALIFVAGMDYAFAVETRGKNVLASAEILAEKELPNMLAQLNRNIAKMK